MNFWQQNVETIKVPKMNQEHKHEYCIVKFSTLIFLLVDKDLFQK